MLEPPAPKPWRASDQEAIELCRDWMVFMGADDVVVAADRAREVCHLYSGRYLAWVDNRRGNLDPELVLWAKNTAAGDGRNALVFLSGGVLPEAQDQADAAGVALLRFDAQGGNLDGVNRVGRRLRESGLAIT
ncbi:hypothetical protein [Leifsonia sp. 22587]|uniref:hypothetical protein n=1 Tax=Leifsonia sp. 22587 TaxID=3453946 RepID=UPI003F872234